MSARVRLLATATVGALALALAGCMPSLPFGPGSTAPGGSGPGGSGGGEVQLPSASLPADWPNELPLPDGQLVTAFSGGGIHSLVYRVANVDVGQRLVDDVVALGFTLEATSDMGQLVTNILSRDGWNVSVAWLTDDDEVTLTYTSGEH